MFGAKHVCISGSDLCDVTLSYEKESYDYSEVEAVRTTFDGRVEGGGTVYRQGSTTCGYITVKNLEPVPRTYWFQLAYRSPTDASRLDRRASSRSPTLLPGESWRLRVGTARETGAAVLEEMQVIDSANRVVEHRRDGIRFFSPPPLTLASKRLAAASRAQAQAAKQQARAERAKQRRHRNEVVLKQNPNAVRDGLIWIAAIAFAAAAALYGLWRLLAWLFGGL